VSFDLYTRSILVLLGLIAVLALFAWLARRFGLATRLMPSGGKRRLAIVEILPLDGRRRLVLLRRDATEHLVLLGPDGALVVERGVTAATPSGFAAELAEGNR
jgi:flagellar protein FliO/FliZ